MDWIKQPLHLIINPICCHSNLGVGFGKDIIQPPPPPPPPPPPQKNLIIISAGTRPKNMNSSARQI